MKTIFLKNLKHSMFLILAILATITSFSQPIQNLSTSTIGSSKTPDISTVQFDTGGRNGSTHDTGEHTPSTNDTGGSGGRGTSTTGDYSSDTGGGKSTDGGLNFDLSTTVDTGVRDTGGAKGTSSDTGQYSDTGGGRGSSTTGDFACDYGVRLSDGGLNANFSYANNNYTKVRRKELGKESLTLKT